METVRVGNPGNAGDTRYPDASNGIYNFGAVGYTYNIGKYEVTADQYCEFLNAVAKTDTYELYNTNMWSIDGGCKIQQSGSSGNYSYSVASDWANRPVNIVSWGDAARFANWLHNGQPTGAQDLTTTDAQLLAVTRQANATWVITSEDEWYKAGCPVCRSLPHRIVTPSRRSSLPHLETRWATLAAPFCACHSHIPDRAIPKQSRTRRGVVDI